MILCTAMLIGAGAQAQTPHSTHSLYQLDVPLTNQRGEAHGLDVYAGHPVLITMFYSSCAHTCPLLIETVRAVERAASSPSELRVLMISVDPVRDTPATLAKLAQERRIDAKRWSLVNANAADVRKIAAALGIQYKQSPDGEFNHSSVISVLNAQGEITKQSSTLGSADEALVAALRAPK
jgi:protein SCO1/2